MSIFLIPLLALLGSSGAAPARTETRPQARHEMTTYYVGFLRKGPAWTAEETPEVRRIQEGHMEHIGRMAGSGRLLLAGPFQDDGDLRGMLVFKAATMEEAMALASEDPAVKAGRLTIDMHPWLSAKGIGIDPSRP